MSSYSTHYNTDSDDVSSVTSDVDHPHHHPHCHRHRRHDLDTSTSSNHSCASLSSSNSSIHSLPDLDLDDLHHAEKPRTNSLAALVQDIRAALGPSSGIDSDDVDENDLIDLMKAYVSRETDWREYALGDPSRAYTRNLVDEGNGKANLLILVWTPGMGSLIHDHANAHCIMKVLKGSLVETQYEWPAPSSSPSTTNQEPKSSTCTTKTTTPLKIRKSTTLERDDVAYISDNIGLHRMANPSTTVPAVSLHLYTPPYAAKFGCNKYDEKTGKATHITLNTYFSKYGLREEGRRVSEGSRRAVEKVQAERGVGEVLN